MKNEKKIKYEKPTALSMGETSFAFGQDCLDGTGAEGECASGALDGFIPACTGPVAEATTQCSPGTSAEQGCANGTTPLYFCLSGSGD